MTLRTDDAPQADDAMGKFFRRQNRAHEVAHREAITVKPLGYKLGRQGIDTTKLYANPDFLPFPLEHCQYLARLSDAQRSVLSAMYFASQYRSIVSAENQVVRHNIQTSERNYPRFSDEYMVLFHETDEEYDHVSAFRSFLVPFLGSATHLDDSQAFEGWPFARVLDPQAGRLDDAGFGALFLLYRYLANCVLKQLEGFMLSGLEPSAADPAAAELNHAHLTDESRHLTTSLELGLGLLRKSVGESRKRVVELLGALTYLTIESRFGRDPERRSDFRGVADFALRRALERPDFANLGVAFDELKQGWARQGIGYRESDLYTAAMRWHAKQITRFMELAELKLSRRSEAVERVFALAGAKDPAATLPSTPPRAAL